MRHYYEIFKAFFDISFVSCINSSQGNEFCNDRRFLWRNSHVYCEMEKSSSVENVQQKYFINFISLAITVDYFMSLQCNSFEDLLNKTVM